MVRVYTTGDVKCDVIGIDNSLQLTHASSLFILNYQLGTCCN